MDSIYIKNCSFGLGVFAKKDIKKGEKILDFIGPIISKQEAEGPMGNPLQIDKNKYINLEKPGVLVNHSCQPNAGIVNDTVLVVIMDIKKDEEIFYDYSTTMDEDNWTLQCKCINQNCRQIVSDFKYLSQELQKKYLELRVVQNFIQKQYNKV